MYASVTGPVQGAEVHEATKEGHATHGAGARLPHNAARTATDTCVNSSDCPHMLTHPYSYSHSLLTPRVGPWREAAFVFIHSHLFSPPPALLFCCSLAHLLTCSLSHSFCNTREHAMAGHNTALDEAYYEDRPSFLYTTIHEGIVHVRLPYPLPVLTGRKRSAQCLRAERLALTPHAPSSYAPWLTRRTTP
jgi:hypothetical protein